MRQLVRTGTALGVGAALLLSGAPSGAAVRTTSGAPSWDVPVADPVTPGTAPTTGLQPDPDRGALADAPDAPTGAPAPLPADATAEVLAPDGTTARPAAAADRVLVEFADGVAAAEQTEVLAAEGAYAEDPVGGTTFVQAQVGDQDPAAVADALAADPRVTDVQLDVVRTAQVTPDDPLVADAAPYLELLRLPRAWDRTTGSGQVIAVLDTGVDPTHAELAGRLTAGYDVVNDDADPTDDQWHGTGVAGAAAARAGNGTGSVGSAYGATIMPVKVLDAAGSGYDSDVAEGIRWATAHGADVINLSLGGPGTSPVLRSALQDAVAAGVVVLAAAGNTGTDEPQYPGAYASEIAGMLSVGATDDAGVLTDFSSWGDTVTLAAPGSQIVVPRNRGGYVLASGTSFSTPLVSGAAALLGATGLDPAQIEAALVSSARDAGPRGRDPWYGAGVVDVAAALGLGADVPLERAPGDLGVDDTPARAVALAVGATASGTLAPEGDQDWFAVSASTTGWFRVTVTPSGGAATTRPQVTVLAADGEVLASGAADEAGDAFTLDVPVPAAGTLRVGVANVAGAWGDTYAVSVRPVAGTSSPVGTGQHAWVLDTSVTQHDAGLPVRPTLTVTLGRAPVASSVSASTVRLVDGSTGATVAATRSYASGVLSVTPTADLVGGRHYQLVVGGLVDATGDRQDAPFRSFFTVAADGDRFTPVDPWRVLDTRKAVGATGPVAPATPVRVDFGTAVPADATAVVLNVTAVQPRASGWVRVYPATSGGAAAPAVSNLNVVPGVDQPNAVTVALGEGGDITLATSTTTHLLADVAGYYRAGGSTAYVPVDPVRLMDTRNGTGGVAKATVSGGRWVDLVVRGRAGVPADAAAVVLNVTGVAPSAATNIRVFPTPAASEAQGPPTSSSLNLVPGRAQPNLVTVKVGDGGRVRFWNQSGTVNLVADLAGYYTPTGDRGFVPVAPARIADSRAGLGLAAGLRPGVGVDLRVTGAGGVPAGADAAVLNVTAVKADRATDLRVFPAGGAVVPLVSNLNMVPGRDEPNLVLARLGTGGAVRLWTGANVHVVVDVSGYFRR